MRLIRIYKQVVKLYTYALFTSIIVLPQPGPYVNHYPKSQTKSVLQGYFTDNDVNSQILSLISQTSSFSQQSKLPSFQEKQYISQTEQYIPEIKWGQIKEMFYISNVRFGHENRVNLIIFDVIPKKSLSEMFRNMTEYTFYVTYYDNDNIKMGYTNGTIHRSQRYRNYPTNEWNSKIPGEGYIALSYISVPGQIEGGDEFHFSINDIRTIEVGSVQPRN